MTKEFNMTGTCFPNEHYMVDTALNIQLKSTYEKISFYDSILKYELHNLKNYNDLRRINIQTPRILIVVYMPDSTDEWITYQDESIQLYRNAFWVSLRGMPETSNKSSITIDIPSQHRFCAAALNEIMDKIAKGEVV